MSVCYKTFEPSSHIFQRIPLNAAISERSQFEEGHEEIPRFFRRKPTNATNVHISKRVILGGARRLKRCNQCKYASHKSAQIPTKNICLAVMM